MEKRANIGSTRKNLADEVYSWLKTQLLNRTYKPGERLYVEKIAQQLGVSYTPVQQAISKLTKEGLVISKPRRGATVASLSSKDIEEIFDLRKLLECYAVELIKSIPSDTEKAIEDILKEMEELIDKREKILEFTIKDKDFHLSIVRLASNEKLYEIYQHIDNWMHTIRFYHMQTTSKERIIDAVAEHRRIWNSLQKGNLREARETIQSHIQITKELVLRKVGKEALL